MKNKIKELKRKANWVRKKILDIASSMESGHLSPSLSCVEILVALYCEGFLHVDAKDPSWPERDRFILSKGHAALVLYVILASEGFFPLSDLDRFTKDGTKLGRHPENSVPGVETFTGSLGHGLPIGAGLALGAKLDNKKYLSVALMGDGECHEGSVWEAAMFAAARKLNNLVVIIDHNGLSATDVLENYLSVEPLKKKWESFGWDVLTTDGHCFNDLISVLKGIRSRSSTKPLAIIASTIKGKGISFMQNNVIWHYRIPTDEELKIAYKELELGEKEI